MSFPHSSVNGFAWHEALRKDRQRNVRQRNNSRHCLFFIPLPNIPLPVLPFFGCGCRAVPSVVKNTRFSVSRLEKGWF